jgi:NAD(P)-dependent dehydrogenase (short-subunit alcohol dehydrogenase family)
MVTAKIVLVTGAGQGIGRAIAIEMAAQGAAAVSVADRDHATAAETAQLVGQAGGDAVAIACDVRDGRQIEAMVQETVARFGGLDVLVNNAGIIETTLTGETTVDTLSEEIWDTVQAVNLKAPWLAMKAAAPHLRRSERGPNIVNAASVSGITGFPAAPAYCASKGGLVQLTRAAAADLAPTVRCNCFCPATIRTPMAQAFIEESDDPAGRERAMTGQQMIDRLGTPEEVAKLVCFLASDDAAFITACAYYIDGGALSWMGPT